MAEAKTPQTPLIVVVLSSAFEHVHYALATAAAAAAIDRPTTLFFAQGAVRAIAGTKASPGWHRLAVEDAGLGGKDAATLEAAFRIRGVASFEELLTACQDLGITLLVCSMGLRVADLTRQQLRTDLTILETGLTDVLSRPGTPVFI
jgi:peroxiredoxin family protein